jgi:hypothetical protein
VSTAEVEVRKQILVEAEKAAAAFVRWHARAHVGCPIDHNPYTDEVDVARRSLREAEERMTDSS